MPGPFVLAGGALAPGHTVILCDTSSSMAGPAGSRRKIDLLREVLARVYRPGCVLLAFSSTASYLQRPHDLPEPCGSTALAKALVLAKSGRPTRAIVLSDGMPDDEEEALAAAVALDCPVETCFCGPDGDVEGIRFMRKLAWGTGGQAAAHDLRRPGAVEALVGEVRRVLALPPPGGGAIGL